MSAEEREEIMRILDAARNNMLLLRDGAAQIYVLMDELVSMGVLPKYIQTLANDLGAEANALADDLNQRFRVLREEVKESALFVTPADTD